MMIFGLSYSISLLNGYLKIGELSRHTSEAWFFNLIVNLKYSKCIDYCTSDLVKACHNKIVVSSIQYHDKSIVDRRALSVALTFPVNTPIITHA